MPVKPHRPATTPPSDHTAHDHTAQRPHRPSDRTPATTPPTTTPPSDHTAHPPNRPPTEPPTEQTAHPPGRPPTGGARLNAHPPGGRPIEYPIVRRILNNGFELDDDRERIDLEAVHDYLCNESYWAKGRSREDVARTVREAARVIGLYHEGRQVGFARVLSDQVHMAYL